MTGPNQGIEHENGKEDTENPLTSTREVSPSQRSLRSVPGKSSNGESTEVNSPERGIGEGDSESLGHIEEGLNNTTTNVDSGGEDVAQDETGDVIPELTENNARKQFLVEEQKKKNVISTKDVKNYIKEYVRCHVYPKMKFFRRSDSVASRSKVAQLLLNEVSGIPKERIQERDDWWTKYVRIVRSTIDDRRSANTNAIKDNFMRKCEFLHEWLLL